MKAKITNWLWTHRVVIGYSLGIANIASGLANIVLGNTVNGAIFLVVGLFLTYDVKSYK